MAKFVYKAKDWSGKLVKGQLELANKKICFLKLTREANRI